MMRLNDIVSSVASRLSLCVLIFMLIGFLFSVLILLVLAHFACCSSADATSL